MLRTYTRKAYLTGQLHYIAALNDLRGFEFSPILLVCFLMFVVFKEIFYGFRFVFIGVYREQSRRR